MAQTSTNGHVAPQAQHLYKFAGLLFLLALAFQFFRPLSRVLLLIYAAAIVAIGFNAIVRRIPVKRPFATGLLALVVLVALGAALWFGGLTVIRQLQDLAASLPAIRAELAEWGELLKARLGIDAKLVSARTQEMADGFVENLSGGEILRRTGGIIELLTIPILILFGALFAVGKPNERLLIPMLRAVPEERRSDFERMLTRLGERLTGYITGTLISMATVGVLATIAFYIIGVPYALLLGVVNGFTEIVPIIGPWVGGLPAIIVAFVDDPMKGVWATVAIISIQTLEAQIILPYVMSKTADVHPFVTLFSIFLFGSIFGFLGVLLALPLVILFWTIIETLWVERSLDAGHDHIPAVVEE